MNRVSHCTWLFNSVASASVTLGALMLAPFDSHAQQPYAPAPSVASNGDDDKPNSVVSFSGMDFAPDATYGYTGILLALNGDFGKSGFVLRFFGAYGDYSYLSEGTKFNGKDVDLDVALGYQFVSARFVTAIYAGLDYRDIEISPFDPFNDIQGSETGFKVLGNVTTDEELPYYASLDGAYSTAFESWYALLRLGFNWKHFVIGPEGLLSGEEGDPTQRIGGFAAFRFDFAPSVPVELTVNAGHQFVKEESEEGSGSFSTTGGEGAYGGISASISF